MESLQFSCQLNDALQRLHVSSACEEADNDELSLGRNLSRTTKCTDRHEREKGEREKKEGEFDQICSFLRMICILEKNLALLGTSSIDEHLISYFIPNINAADEEDGVVVVVFHAQIESSSLSPLTDYGSHRKRRLDFSINLTAMSHHCSRFFFMQICWD